MSRHNCNRGSADTDGQSNSSAAMIDGNTQSPIVIFKRAPSKRTWTNVELEAATICQIKIENSIRFRPAHNDNLRNALWKNPEHVRWIHRSQNLQTLLPRSSQSSCIMFNGYAITFSAARLRRARLQYVVSVAPQPPTRSCCTWSTAGAAYGAYRHAYMRPASCRCLRLLRASHQVVICSTAGRRFICIPTSRTHTHTHEHGSSLHIHYR